MNDLVPVIRWMIVVILDLIGKRFEVKGARNGKEQEDLDQGLKAKEEGERVEEGAQVIVLALHMTPEKINVGEVRDPGITFAHHKVFSEIRILG